MGMALVYCFDRDDNCVPDLYGAIFNINHTGQEHCGMVCYDGENFSRQTEHGLVREMKVPESVCGYCGVGNVGKVNDHQPLIFYPNPSASSAGLPVFALTFDGFIANGDELRACSDAFLSPYDAELVGRLISRSGNFSQGLEELARAVRGYYCLGILTKEEAYAARSPLGTRPLMISQGKTGCAAISESRAFRKIHMKSSTDLNPGEIVRIDKFGVQHVNTVGGYPKKLCSFLLGYYSWVDSVIEGVPVGDVRERAMRPLVERDKHAGLVVDFATAIEDSGKAYGEGYALLSGVPFRSTLIKYPYWCRSYDRPECTRSDEATGKVSSIDYRLKNKVVVLCDDSVRRGTVTSGGPIHYARAAGVERIHMRIGTPRNTHYCRLDFRDALDETLPANRYPTNEEMAKFLGVDSIDFPTVDEFVDAILESAKENGANLRREDLCLGCYNGDFSFLA